MKKYWGIIYLKNGDACICSACDSEEEVMETLRSTLSKKYERINQIAATSYISREVKEGDKVPTLQDLLGCPKSRDLIQNKKAMKEIAENAKSI